MNRSDRMRLQFSVDDQISELYNYTIERLHEMESSIDFEDVEHPSEQLQSLKQIIEKLTTKKECEDCVVYEKQLQKLEADIRQHIKLEHQFKLYQDSLEDKANEKNKEWTGIEKEIDGYKRKVEELREIKTNHVEQIGKLQQENQQLKNQIKSLTLKRSKLTESERDRMDRPGHSVQRRQITKRLEARTMLIDRERAPLTKTINFNSNEERKSVDKAKGITITEDMSKHRQSLNNKSSNLLKTGAVDRKKFQIVMRDKENQKRKINKLQYKR